jgi:alkanesulfonate monooxygenase SsuD/methylene tetrahydromethanopterin reductase-like flavin-dependent oxidoreductase (luciferase family)
MTVPFGPASICYKPYVCGGEAATRVDDLLAQATAAERAGFDGVTISEHHLGFPGYFPNPLQAASWILERTTRVWVAPAPMLALLRPVNLVAEEIAWLAARFPRRVGAGFAAGAMTADFEFASTDQTNLVARFEHALETLTELLGGAAPEALLTDPAFSRLVEHPVRVLSAASSHTACRRAARIGCGILLESVVEPEEVGRMIDTYRSAGGSGPACLVRRAWVGSSPPLEQERAWNAMMRATVPVYNRGAWLTPENMIVSGDANAVTDQLGAIMAATGADCLNLRVHVPGVGPDTVIAQIDALGPVLSALRPLLAPAGHA